MNKQRRTFLKGAGTAAVVGAAGMRAANAAMAAPEAAQKSGGGSSSMPKNMTFVTLRDGDAYRLGVKTDRGVLDVRKAAAALNVKAPATIDDVIQGRGDNNALAPLVQKALAAKN